LVRELKKVRERTGREVRKIFDGRTIFFDGSQVKMLLGFISEQIDLCSKK
jgi:hypothetical protein